MIARLGRSLAWRLRRAAVALAAPQDLDAWFVEDRVRWNKQRRAMPEEEVTDETVTQEQLLRFCRLLAPFDVESYRKVRIGGENDGGYVFIDDFADVSTVISCGISNDVSCDLAFADLGKEVMQFDHTVDGPPIQHEQFRFHKQAIDETLKIPGSTRLSEVLRSAGNADRCDLLLKVDIEGGEWSSFATMSGTDLLRCRQIACEMHGTSKLGNQEFFKLYEMALSRIHEGFFPAHIHANNFRGFASVAGVPIPDVVEVTFVNKTLYRPGLRQKAGPSTVDAPNNVEAHDLYLGSPFSLTID